MKSIIAATAALVAFAASGGVAAAATYDFGLLATNAGVGEGSWDSRGDATNVAGGDFDDDTDRFIVDGIGVTADGYTYSISSIDTAGPHDIFTVSNSGDLGFYRKADAYLDGLSGNKEAGIGVCGSITNTFQCNPSNDDNIGPDGGLDSQNQSGYLEFVTLTFDVDVQISDMMFRDDNHKEISSGLIGLSLDDPSSGEMLFVVTDISSLTGADAGINQSHNFFSSTWSFAAISAEFDRSCGSAYEGDDDNEISTFGSFEVQTCTNFYIDGLTATPVPVPAAGFLLLGGLGGLVAMKRRRKS